MLFDEPLNYKLQREQSDLHVGIWDCGTVQTRYLGSEFFGEATARDVVGKSILVLGDIGLKNLVQVSMDGSSLDPSASPTKKSKSGLHTTFFLVHVAIFSCIATQVSPFLTAYQTDAHHAHFMTGDMYKLFKGMFS